MLGKIKKIDGIYPVTVIDAIKVGDGTKDTLKEYLKKENSNAFPSIDFENEILPVINENANVKVLEAEKLTESFGTTAYVGGVYHNNKVYFIPNGATNVLVWDLLHDTYYTIGNLSEETFKWTSGFLSPNGKIYGVPRSVPTLLEIDPILDTVKEIDFGYVYDRQYTDYQSPHHYGGAMTPNGVIYCPPSYQSTTILKIDTITHNYEEINIYIQSVFTASIYNPNGKCYFLSADGTMVILDTETDAFEILETGLELSTYDISISPYDTNIMYAYMGGNSKGILKIDATTNSCTILATGSCESCYGTCMGINGKMYGVHKASGLIYEFDISTETVSTVGTLPNYSGDPITAGMVLCPNGTIYLPAGTGGAYRIKFDSVKRRLSDYAVHSMYLAKY